MLRDISWTHIMVGKFSLCWYDRWNRRWGLEVCIGRLTLIYLWL